MFPLELRCQGAYRYLQDPGLDVHFLARSARFHAIQTLCGAIWQRARASGDGDLLEITSSCGHESKSTPKAVLRWLFRARRPQLWGQTSSLASTNAIRRHGTLGKYSKRREKGHNASRYLARHLERHISSSYTKSFCFRTGGVDSEGLEPGVELRSTLTYVALEGSACHCFMARSRCRLWLRGHAVATATVKAKPTPELLKSLETSGCQAKCPWWPRS